MSRSIWKPVFTDKKKLIMEKKLITLYSRSETITKDYIGFIIKIYNGIRFYEINVVESMVGHKFGEFASTRKYPIHKIKKKK